MTTQLRPVASGTQRAVGATLPSMTLWDQYATGCRIARDKLLEQHLGLVYHIARQMKRALGDHVDLGDLVSAGTSGMMLALQRFDASRGLSFSTFAVPRIRGSMLDDLRKGDQLSRLARQRERAILQAQDTLSATLHRLPTEAEVANRLEISVATLWRWKADIEQNNVISLDVPASSNSDTMRNDIDSIPDIRFGNIEDRVSTAFETKFLREAIQELKEQEQVVLSLYYFEDLSSGEIASVLGVSESRISQIRARALEQLREKVGAIRGYMVV